jgi:malonyl-CoA decarboxylase
MAFGRFQDFLSGLVKGQRGRLFAGNAQPSMAELLQKIMGNTGEVSAIVTARELLDRYGSLSDDEKLSFFETLEQEFNADKAAVEVAYKTYVANPNSANLNALSRVTEPRRHELLRRLNQTPDATHDLVSMRTDLLKLLKPHPQLKSVDDDFVRMFMSWFGRGFLVLKTINWSTSAAILERIIRYEAVHEIKDWNDLRSRIDPPNRRCFAFFHPALVDEPLIFVEVALGQDVPGSIFAILNDRIEDDDWSPEYKTATFYSISNCQPGLKNISFGNFLIKQVVQELQAEFPSIKQFVTLSPIPGFANWLNADEATPESSLAQLKRTVREFPEKREMNEEQSQVLRRLMFNYLAVAKQGKYPVDPVARFHLGNGAMIHQIHTGADVSKKGLAQSFGTMVNYLYDLRYIERNHESYVSEGAVEFSDKLKSLLLKS